MRRCLIFLSSVLDTQQRGQHMRINCRQGSGLSFLACGMAFTAIGFSGQTAFIGIGMAFLGLAAVHFAKALKR